MQATSAGSYKSEVPSVRATCPANHTVPSQQRTARVAESSGPPIERDAAGVWHVRGYKEARAILRGAQTKQAGFRAELLEEMPRALNMNMPILYQEGKEHQLQRKQTARFFTPKTTSTKYRQLMEGLSDQLIAGLVRTGRGDLSTISMTLAVRVAAYVVGLTNSRLSGINKRLDAFFSNDIVSFGWHPRTLYKFFQNQLRVIRFFYLDVKPAINARKRAPQEDVISHLLERGYRDPEILTECITYAAAGMVTTREFICVAAWHLLERPALRQQFLEGGQEKREHILHELLRLEPVVGHLYRRTTDDLQLESDGGAITIPKGELIDIHIYAVNADENLVGELPLVACPGRQLKLEGVAPSVMGFGDGHHRCPGAYIAIQETDIFLQRLLALEGLEIERKPALRWNELTKGYELRDFMVVVT